MTARGVLAPREYAVRQKKARKPKPAPALIKHEQIGFDRVGLQSSGALESDVAEPPTLDNEALEFFDKWRFIFPDGDPFNDGFFGSDMEGEVPDFDGGNPPAEWDEAYENMKPAFRLVSRWMTEPKFHSFWRMLFHGQVKTVHRSAHKRRTMLDEKEIKYYEARRNTTDSFNNINHFFCFKPLSHAWAETRSQSVPVYVLDETEPDLGHLGGSFVSMTFLHEDFLRLSHTEFPHTTKSQQLRFLYFLAITIAHEMAHLTWQHAWALRYDHEYGNGNSAKKPLDWEPYFYLDDAIPRDYNHNELGIAWECFMFGGRIQPLNQSPSPFVPDGLAVLPMDMVRDTHFWDPQCRIAPLETAWISNQFSEAWWRRYGKSGKPGRPRLAPVRATVNRTMDSDVFRNNEHDMGSEAQRVANHIVGGSPGHRFVEDRNDTWMLTGVVGSLWPRGRRHLDYCHTQ